MITSSKDLIRFFLTICFLSCKINLEILKPMIEKSSQRQMNSRELSVGGKIVNRFLMNGLIRVGRTAIA